MGNISYVKNKNNSMYFIEIDGMRIAEKVCEYLNISLEEYINTIIQCGGKYSPKYGMFLPNEECANECVVILTLLQQ